MSLSISNAVETCKIIHFADIPKDLQEEAMQLAMILMPDENREALQTILAFLNEFAAMSAENQARFCFFKHSVAVLITFGKWRSFLSPLAHLFGSHCH